MESPILDCELADQFFVASSPEDAAELRDMLAGFRTDVTPRFAVLRSWSADTGADPVAAQRELHQLRGVVANFGFSAAAQRLSRLEHAWAGAAAADRSESLRVAAADLEAGLRALHERFPYLQG